MAKRECAIVMSQSPVAPSQYGGAEDRRRHLETVRSEQHTRCRWHFTTPVSRHNLERSYTSWSLWCELVVMFVPQSRRELVGSRIDLVGGDQPSVPDEAL